MGKKGKRKGKTPEPLVYFNVEAEPDANTDDIKQTLESLSNRLDIRVLTFRRIGKTRISGATNKKTYERVFEAKIRLGTRTIPNLNKGPYQIQEWVEVKPAKVPLALEGKIKAIRLAENVYLTD